MEDYLIEGAETIVHECLKIQKDEKVVIVNDGNDQDLLDALIKVAEEASNDVTYEEYPEPETSGTEPPEEVAELLKQSDVFIAPTLKSISHTNARKEALKHGARGATLPTINKEIWKGGLQADYQKVQEITDKIHSEYNGEKVRIKTPSGTDLEFDIGESLEKDTGIVHESGKFSNLPAGEIHTGVQNCNGILVTDHFQFAEEGLEIVIEDSKVKDIRNTDGDSKLDKVLEETPCALNIAEFGFGTNPEATIIGNVLQDEKVLGTVHIALGDNSHYFSEGQERYNECSIHWDSVCAEPTVWFGDKKVLDQGKPIFLD